MVIYKGCKEFYNEKLIILWLKCTSIGREYMNYYEEIKGKLIDNEITKRAKDYSKNKSDLTTYYNVGKLLVKLVNIMERG